MFCMSFQPVRWLSLHPVQFMRTVNVGALMAGEGMDKPYKLRFRHLSGDVGPLTFQENSTVLAMKNQIWEDWPTEEPLSSLVCFVHHANMQLH